MLAPRTCVHSRVIPSPEVQPLEPAAAEAADRPQAPGAADAADGAPWQAAALRDRPVRVVGTVPLHHSVWGGKRLAILAATSALAGSAGMYWLMTRGTAEVDFEGTVLGGLAGALAGAMGSVALTEAADGLCHWIERARLGCLRGRDRPAHQLQRLTQLARDAGPLNEAGMRQCMDNIGRLCEASPVSLGGPQHALALAALAAAVLPPGSERWRDTDHWEGAPGLLRILIGAIGRLHRTGTITRAQLEEAVGRVGDALPSAAPDPAAARRLAFELLCGYLEAIGYSHYEAPGNGHNTLLRLQNLPCFSPITHQLDNVTEGARDVAHASFWRHGRPHTL